MMCSSFVLIAPWFARAWVLLAFAQVCIGASCGAQEDVVEQSFSLVSSAQLTTADRERLVKEALELRCAALSCSLRVLWPQLVAWPFRGSAITCPPALRVV